MPAYNSSKINVAYNLQRMAEINRQFSSDNLTKSFAPNADELCTHKLNFGEVMHHLKSGTASDIEHAIEDSTEKIPVASSRRQASIELSQAALMNLTMNKLLSHSIREERSVLDNFRPQ